MFTLSFALFSPFPCTFFLCFCSGKIYYFMACWLDRILFCCWLAVGVCNLKRLHRFLYPSFLSFLCLMVFGVISFLSVFTLTYTRFNYFSCLGQDIEVIWRFWIVDCLVPHAGCLPPLECFAVDGNAAAFCCGGCCF